MSDSSNPYGWRNDTPGWVIQNDGERHAEANEILKDARRIDPNYQYGVRLVDPNWTSGS